MYFLNGCVILSEIGSDPSDWILVTGFWDDLNWWDDTANWID